MGFAAALLAPGAWRDLRREPVDRRSAGVILLSGVLLSGHFLLWTASLALTSIASSVLLVCMHPVIVAPLGKRFLGDAIAPRTLLGGSLSRPAG
jgi:drug/metabolite transporter (DMT)-like permease